MPTTETQIQGSRDHAERFHLRVDWWDLEGWRRHECRVLRVWAGSLVDIGEDDRAARRSTRPCCKALPLGPICVQVRPQLQSQSDGGGRIEREENGRQPGWKSTQNATRFMAGSRAEDGR